MSEDRNSDQKESEKNGLWIGLGMAIFMAGLMMIGWLFRGSASI